MLEISEYFKKKSETELKIAVLEESLECEKMLNSQDIRVICDGSCMVHGTDINNKHKSQYRILPEASDKLHRVLLKALGEYKAELTKLQEELESGKAKA
ncbi:unnamed protein product [marine sediment metagenome]|uniref:Uncharacterized protein n=1 Tax=marine sediment metagenome TaxID=412755 RepID=X0WCW5_9ZZZZ